MTTRIRGKRGPLATKPPFSKEALRLGRRIREVRGDEPLTHLAERLGVSQQALSNIENGLTNPDDARTRRTLQRLATALKNDFGRPELKDYGSGHEREIPIEARVAAGAPIIRIEEGETITVDERLIRTTGDICALRVSGESMVEDHILDGDILICRRTAQPRKDSIVVVDFKGEVGASIKRWRRKDDTVTLSSDHYNNEMPKYEYPAWRLGKVFEVVGLIRSMK